MIQLASADKCSGCGLCAYKCPKECISMRENRAGVIYPSINYTNCIDCHLCEKMCPVINPVKSNLPYIAYAAHSCDEDIRRNGASGGIATAMYKFAIEKGYSVYGAVQDEDFIVRIKLAKKYSEALSFQNSKYVFSDLSSAFSSILNELNTNRKVLFIALPCQVAAIQRLCKAHENLIVGEVVCHGVAPFSYLRQHIDTIEKRYRQKSSKMYFRDPKFGTHLFYFSLYNANGVCYYAKRTKEGDSYQYAYHKSVSYRENCYHCTFAKTERVSDFTLNDYKQLGKISPTSFQTKKKLSSILVNTSKGESFVKEMLSENLLIAEERPIEEPVNADPRLKSPTPKCKERFIFEQRIVEFNGDFEKAIHPLVVKYIHSVRWNNIKINIIYLLRRIKKMLKTK